MVTRVFFDCEFIEDGLTIDLVSLGAVDDTGREFYAVSTSFNPAMANDFVAQHVLPQLPPRSDRAWMSRRDIRDAYHAWLTEPGGEIEQWAYYAAYDHVAVAQLWGPMGKMPSELPWFTNDLMTLWNLAGRPEKPPQPLNQHDALADARWNRALYQRCWQHMGILHGPNPEEVIRPGHGITLKGEHGPELDLPHGGKINRVEDL